MGERAERLMVVAGGLRNWKVERVAVEGGRLLFDVVVVTEKRMWFGAVLWSQRAGLSCVRYGGLHALLMSSSCLVSAATLTFVYLAIGCRRYL